jgi:flagellar biosynthesis GTPase FlhF
LELQWKRRLLHESTPRGNIIMYYDIYKQAFTYVSDQQMNYDILNACAMKYVRIFRCLDFFVDVNILPSGYISPFSLLQEEMDKKEMEAALEKKEAKEAKQREKEREKAHKKTEKEREKSEKRATKKAEKEREKEAKKKAKQDAKTAEREARKTKKNKDKKSSIIPKKKERKILIFLNTFN